MVPTLVSMGKMYALGYLTPTCFWILDNCLDLWIKPIFWFIGLLRSDLLFINSKQQNLRTISEGIGGASRDPWTRKIIYINLRGHIQNMWTVFELFCPPSPFVDSFTKYHLLVKLKFYYMYWWKVEVVKRSKQLYKIWYHVRVG